MSEPKKYQHTLGGIYTMVGTATLQTDKPLSDMASIVVYEAEDGQLWARGTSEFTERFTRIPSGPQDAAFRPDWSLLEATQASLREHMAIIRKLARWLPMDGVRYSEGIVRSDLPKNMLKEQMSPQDWIAAAEYAAKNKL